VLACLLCAGQQVAAQGLEEVVVTGSRLQGLESASTSPILILQRSDIDRLAPASLGDVLQRLPASNGSPSNASTNAGGDGTTRVDLRGFGPGRTLLLLNGRRIVPGGLGGDTSVDLNAIPLSLVERIEVLGTGASAVYGTDAVAGVINVITRPPGSGLRLDVRHSTTEREDGQVSTASAVGGRGDRHSAITVGVDWARQQPVSMDSRAYSRVREAMLADGTVVPFGVAPTPQGYFRVPARNALGLAPDTYTRVEGSTGPTGPDDFRRFSEPVDRFNPNPYQLLQTQSERIGAWVLADRALGADVELRFEALAHQRESAQRQAPAPFQSRFGDAAPLLADGRPGVPASNYYNPFGVDLRDVRRNFPEVGARSFEQRSRTMRLVAVASQARADWSWEAAATWGRNDSRQQTHGELLSERLRLAVGPSGLDAAGRIVCGQVDRRTGRVPSGSVIPGCVPLDLFGGQGPDGRGTVTLEQVAFVTKPLVDSGTNRLTTLDATARGTRPTRLLPHGPLRWAIGAEWRKERAFQRPDVAKAGGTTGGIATNFADGGEASVTDVYLEAGIPLLREAPPARALDLSAGLRGSRSTAFGSDASASAGLTWQLSPAITVRGGFAEVFRAPPLSDLYSSNRAFFAPVRDPCGNSPSPAQRVNCSAAGVPLGSYVQPPADEIPTVVGGNPALVTESGDSLSIGLEFRPSSYPGFSVSLAYWELDLQRAIAELGPQLILDLCAGAGDPDVCRLAARESDGTVRLIDSRLLNVGRESGRGVDASLQLDWQSGGLRASARLDAAHLDSRRIRAAEGADDVEIAGARYGDSIYPRWRGSIRTGLSAQDWSVFYTYEYMSSATECTDLEAAPGLLVGCHRMEPVGYHDIELALNAADGLNVALHARNLSDVEPPRAAIAPPGANTIPEAYRLLGRSYVLSLRYQPR
jgi:outer membrane receptor protein involved in Fe transport